MIANSMNTIISFLLNFGAWILILLLFYFLFQYLDKKFGDTKFFKFIDLKYGQFFEYLSKYKKWQIITGGLSIYSILNILFGSLLYYDLIYETFGIAILIIINFPLILLAMIGMPIF